MSRIRWFEWMILAAIIGVLTWLFFEADSDKPGSKPLAASRSETKTPVPATPVPGDALLNGYADPASPPIEDLKKIHRVVTGYFSVIKNSSRFPIGGNEDLAAALRGENPNLEVFVRAGHPLFSGDGLLIDRWGSPLIVHPQAWKQIELRSAGPDRVAYNEDDLVLEPNGNTRGKSAGIPPESSRN
jgi:hypothetical protein